MNTPAQTTNPSAPQGASPTMEASPAALSPQDELSRAVDQAMREYACGEPGAAGGQDPIASPVASPISPLTPLVAVVRTAHPEYSQDLALKVARQIDAVARHVLEAAGHLVPAGHPGAARDSGKNFAKNAAEDPGKHSSGQGVQSWSKTITLFPGGGDVSALFNLYQSQGDQTIVGNQTIATLLDGPEKVVRYGNLVVGDGTTATSLTASQRCKGLTILCDSLTVKNNATVNMTGKGARVLVNDDPFFPFVDFKVPTQISLSSNQVTLAQALTTIKTQGLAPWDKGTFQALVAAMYGFNLGVTLDGNIVLLSSAGCGIAIQGNGGGISGSQVPGFTGVAGINGGMGSGGSGGMYNISNAYSNSGKPGSGCPYSGGSGSGGASAYPGLQGNNVTGKCCSRYSGPGGGGGTLWTTIIGYSDEGAHGSGGGGAGNPVGSYSINDTTQSGGNGTSGKLVIITGTFISVQSGGKIEANGVPGATVSTGSPSGGSSGGGHVSILTPSLTNNGTIQAAGGASAPGGGGWAPGGPGGAGSVVTQTFTAMGW